MHILEARTFDVRIQALHVSNVRFPFDTWFNPIKCKIGSGELLHSPLVTSEGNSLACDRAATGRRFPKLLLTVDPAEAIISHTCITCECLNSKHAILSSTADTHHSLTDFVYLRIRNTLLQLSENSSRPNNQLILRQHHSANMCSQPGDSSPSSIAWHLSRTLGEKRLSDSRQTPTAPSHTIG